MGVGNFIDHFGRLGWDSCWQKVEELAKGGEYVELPYKVKEDVNFEADSNIKVRKMSTA